MGRFAHLALFVLSFSCAYAQLHPSSQSPFGTPSKRIAIVGAGTAGLGVVKTLIGDLPEEARQGWEIVVFEKRGGVGGIWLPDPNTPHPPELPETPLYTRLMTNTPHPIMTIPHFPFRPKTALYPQHPSVLQYHEDIVNHWNLSSYIKFNHEILETRWGGSPEAGQWNIKVHDRQRNETTDSEFDHLVIATGHNHYPHEPAIAGRDLWEASTSNRLAIHSIFYRNPEDYKGKNVVVVGDGASSRDIVQQIVEFANSTYVSVKKSPVALPIPFPDIPGTEIKPRITHFTRDALVFDDNTTLTHIDTVVFGTGYELRVPFLTAGGHLPVVAQQGDSAAHLTTNLRRVHPLYEHVLSLDAAYPVGALYMLGLPIFVANAVSDAAQSLFVAYTIAHPELLATREAFLADLRADEASQRAAGFDPAYVGHRIVRKDGATTYQDGLVEYLQTRGLAGQPGVPRGRRFTDAWRKTTLNVVLLLRKAWIRVEERGEAYVREWLEGVETEEEWADLMDRLAEWERRTEEEEGTYDPQAYEGPLF